MYQSPEELINRYCPDLKSTGIVTIGDICNLEIADIKIIAKLSERMKITKQEVKDRVSAGILTLEQLKDAMEWLYRMYF